MADDTLQKEFEAEFQVFVERGGLDSTQCVNQGYELMRRQLLCTHGEVRSQCAHCKPVLPPYMPK